MHGKVTCLDSKEDEILALPLHDISQPSDLNISTSSLKENLNTDADILGRRIVNISHLFNAIKLIDNHEPFDCSFKDMRIIKEIKYGFKSTFVFKCNMCNTISKISTEDENLMSINAAAVAGIINIGCGFSHLQDITCALEVPTINYGTYNKEHKTVCQGYELAAIKAMDDAAKIEAELAIQAGDIDTDGTPLVAVVADGSWCKRSYKTMYNSPSGMVRYSLLSYKFDSIFNFV